MNDSVSESRDAISIASSRVSDPANTNRHGTEDSAVRATIGAVGFSSRNAMAEPRDSSDDLARKFSLAEVIAGALAIDGRDPSTAVPAPQTPDVHSHLNSMGRNSAIEHVRKFLEWSVDLPYLNEDLFLRQCEDVMANKTQHQAAQSPTSLHVFNFYVACAIGISVSPTSTHLSFLSSSLHSAALGELPSILRTEPALEHIHCLILLVIYSLFNSSGGSAWHLLGLAMKTSISLGLHREPDGHSTLRIAEDDRRRWLFWAVYSFDRYDDIASVTFFSSQPSTDPGHRMISLVMDRPVSIQDEDISVKVS